jgi:hypothetical protein
VIFSNSNATGIDRPVTQTLEGFDWGGGGYGVRVVVMVWAGKEAGGWNSSGLCTLAVLGLNLAAVSSHRVSVSHIIIVQFPHSYFFSKPVATQVHGPVACNYRPSKMAD